MTVKSFDSIIMVIFGETKLASKNLSANTFRKSISITKLIGSGKNSIKVIKSWKKVMKYARMK